MLMKLTPTVEQMFNVLIMAVKLAKTSTVGRVRVRVHALLRGLDLVRPLGLRLIALSTIAAHALRDFVQANYLNASNLTVSVCSDTLPRSFEEQGPAGPCRRERCNPSS